MGDHILPIHWSREMTDKMPYRGILFAIGKKSNVKYDYLFSGKQCVTKSELQRHMDRHNTVPIHKCKVCPKTFKHKQDLNQHMKLHTGVGLHKCKVRANISSQNIFQLVPLINKRNWFLKVVFFVPSRKKWNIPVTFRTFWTPSWNF